MRNNLLLAVQNEGIDFKVAFNFIIMKFIIRLQPSYLLSYLNDEHNLIGVTEHESNQKQNYQTKNWNSGVMILIAAIKTVDDLNNQF